MADEKETRLTPSVGVNPTYGEPDENGFVGVAPEYANFANDTDEPLDADDKEEPVKKEKATPTQETPKSQAASTDK